MVVVVAVIFYYRDFSLIGVFFFLQKVNNKKILLVWNLHFIMCSFSFGQLWECLLFHFTNCFLFWVFQAISKCFCLLCKKHMLFWQIMKCSNSHCSYCNNTLSLALSMSVFLVGFYFSFYVLLTFMQCFPRVVVVVVEIPLSFLNVCKCKNEYTFPNMCICMCLCAVNIFLKVVRFFFFFLLDSLFFFCSLP